MFLLSIKHSMPDLLNILGLTIHYTCATCVLELIFIFSSICFRSRKIEYYSVLQLMDPWFLEHIHNGKPLCLLQVIAGELVCVMGNA